VTQSESSIWDVRQSKAVHQSSTLWCTGWTVCVCHKTVQIKKIFILLTKSKNHLFPEGFTVEEEPVCHKETHGSHDCTSHIFTHTTLCAYSELLYLGHAIVQRPTLTLHFNPLTRKLNMAISIVGLNGARTPCSQSAVSASLQRRRNDRVAV